MKLTCDLCGGTLQINSGGKGATCTNCGLGYTMERLQEKLSGQKIPQTPPVSDPPVSDPPLSEPSDPDPIVLKVLSTKKRPGFAWGKAECLVQKGVVDSGMPYYACINTLDGDPIQVGSLNPGDVAEGGKVMMLLYCDKSLLPTIKTLYVFPEEEYDDGDDGEDAVES